MPARFGSLLNHERHSRRTFFQRRVRAVPRKSPTPVQADFIVGIDNIRRAKLMAENFSAILSNRDREVFSSLRPISVTHPKRVLALSRNLEILIQRRAILVSACSRRVPFTFTTLG